MVKIFEVGKFFKANMLLNMMVFEIFRDLQMALMGARVLVVNQLEQVTADGRSAGGLGAEEIMGGDPYKLIRCFC